MQSFESNRAGNSSKRNYFFVVRYAVHWVAGKCPFALAARAPSAHMRGLARGLIHGRSYLSYFRA